ncbi:MAG: M1 family metallopeptidase, partial [Deltaproteobacteria bacterium]|nr:M1 family metallopeptidase [Deltaproteobacteria bacterium]
MRHPTPCKRDLFQTWFRMACFLWPAVLLFIAAPACPPPAYATAPAPAVHHLSIDFDLGNRRMSGTSRIALPPGSGASLRLDKLDITGVAINGEKAPLLPGENPLVVPPAAGAQEVVITFQKEAPISRDLADNLINPRGIALTDAWHPIPEKEMLFKLTAGIP